VYIPEYYFASKSFDVLSEALNCAYPEKDVPNKTIRRLVVYFCVTSAHRETK
jgi:hypothetical protein